MGTICISVQAVCAAAGGHQWQTSRKLCADAGVPLLAHPRVYISSVPAPIPVCTCTVGAAGDDVAA